MPQDVSSPTSQNSGSNSPLFKQEPSDSDDPTMNKTSAAENNTNSSSNNGGSQRPQVSTSPPPLEATAGLTKLQNSPVFPPRMAASSSAAAAAAAAVLGPLSPLTTVTNVPHQFNNGTPTMISLSTPVFMAVANPSPRIQSIDVNSSPRSTVLDPRISTSALIGSPTTFAPIQPSLTGSPVLSSTGNHTFVPPTNSLQPSRQIIGSQGFPPIHAFAEEPSLRRKLPASNLSNPLYFSPGSAVSSPILSSLIDTPPQQAQPGPLSTAQAQQVQQMLSPLTETTSNLVPPAEQEHKARSTPVKTPKASKTSTPGQRRKPPKNAVNASAAAAAAAAAALASAGSNVPLGVNEGSPREKKRRGRPPTDKPAACSHCGATSTPEWRRGKVAEGVYVPLCNACGLQLAKRNRMQRANTSQNAASSQNPARQPTVPGLIQPSNATDMKPQSISSLLDGKL